MADRASTRLRWTDVRLDADARRRGCTRHARRAWRRSAGARRRHRRGRPRGARRARARATASAGWRSTSSRSSPHRAARRRCDPVSRYPSSDIDLAFIVPTPCRRRAVEATLRAGRRRAARVACDSSTSTAARACRRAPGAWPTGSASRPTTTRSPTKRSPGSASGPSMPSSRPTAPRSADLVVHRGG